MRKTFREKRPSDPNQLAASVVADAIALSEGKNPHAVALSKLGASKGGKLIPAWFNGDPFGFLC